MYILVHCVQALLEENPAKHPIIILKDVPFLHLTAILEFMYAGEVNVAQGCVTFSSFSMIDFLIYLVILNFSDITGIHSSVPDRIRIQSGQWGIRNPDPGGQNYHNFV